jgi:hypothetical protein
MSFMRYISPGFKCGVSRRAIVSAAEEEGAQARIWVVSIGTSCKIASITVLVFPVPGGPEIRKGRSP